MQTFGPVELGRAAQDVWAALEDDACLALLASHPNVSLLYFSRDEYDRDMQDLDDNEILTAVQQRRARWSPRALDDAPDRLFRIQKPGLPLTLLARPDSSAPVSTALATHFQGILTLLAEVVGHGRYEDAEISELLATCLEEEVRLRNEAALAAESASASAPPIAAGFSRLSERAARQAQAIGQALVPLGQSEYARCLPFIDIRRGVFIAPADGELIRGLKSAREPYAPWRDGLVTAWPLRNVDALVAKGKHVATLFLEPGELVHDLAMFTPAQLDREFASRLARASSREPGQMRAHLVNLQLRQVLLKTNLRRVAGSKGQAAVVRLMEAQLSEDSAALSDTLAVHPCWLEVVPQRGLAAAQALGDAERQVLQDAKFLAELLRRAPRPELASWFEKIAQGKKEALTRLATVPGVSP